MEFFVIGLMSGTSLDGLDIAYCHFKYSDKWSFEILKAETVAYDEDLINRLRNSTNLSAYQFVKLHKDLGDFIGNEVNKFKNGLKVDFIASHGHTSFHLPEERINFQLGNGATIAAITKMPVICDFRSLDIALNGQGAPLVPVGDKLLFSDYDALLNIGGFANVSFVKNFVIAYDISPANFALNFFVRKIGLEYDKNGDIGRQSKSDEQLVEKLNSLHFYKTKSPKSLSDHWFYETFLKAVDEQKYSLNEIIASLYEHISTQISEELNKKKVKKCLITGGGAYNIFLVDLIKSKTTAEIVIPDKIIVEYKEALIFAFLGLLRWIQQPNCLSSVTGADYDNIGGSIYLG